MQETHSTLQVEKLWENEWGGKAIFSHGTSTARGIALFITKEMFNKISNVDIGEDGRQIVIDITENEQVISLAAIYAPNDDSPNFFLKLREELTKRSEHKIIVGDFNLTLDVEMDRENNLLQQQ